MTDHGLALARNAENRVRGTRRRVRLRRPYSLVGAGCALFRHPDAGLARYPARENSAAFEQEPRARGTLSGLGALKSTQSAQTKSAQTHGPRRLATSRLVEAIVPQVRQSLGVPRAVFIGLLRIAPGGLTFQATALLELAAAYPPLLAQVGRRASVTGCRTPPSRGPVTRGRRAGTACGLDRRIRETQRRISDAPDPATAPRPVWRLQTPRYEGGMERNLIWTKSRVNGNI